MVACWYLFFLFFASEALAYGFYIVLMRLELHLQDVKGLFEFIAFSLSFHLLLLYHNTSNLLFIFISRLARFAIIQLFPPTFSCSASSESCSLLFITSLYLWSRSLIALLCFSSSLFASFTSFFSRSIFCPVSLLSSSFRHHQKTVENLQLIS